MNCIGRMILVALTPALITAHAAADRAPGDDRPDVPDLDGRIVCAEAGTPIEGAAVSIYTARLREGVSPLCPSCHPDCGKRSVTNADGEFRIESLDPNLIFRALVMRDGYQPAFATDVDPLAEPIEVQLKPIDPEIPPERTVRGRVVDEAGNPVTGAWLQPLGRYRPTRRAAGTTYMGGIAHTRVDVDPLVITNEKGEFTFVTGEGALSIESYLANSRMDPQTAQQMFGDATHFLLAVRAGAPGFARQNALELAHGGAMNEITLSQGVTIKGRVVDGRTPLGGVEIGFIQGRRSSERFFGEFTIGTREDGTFEIANMPADEELFVYGKVQSMRGRGALPTRSFRTGREGEVLDLGDLRAREGITIRGRFVLSDGGEIPPGSQVFVSRDRAWDLLRINIEPDGSFVISDLPRESIGISDRVLGYHISLRNPSIDRLNVYQIVGRIECDIDDLVILLEPGQPDAEEVAALREQSRYISGSPEDPGQQPLRGYAPEE